MKVAWLLVVFISIVTYTNCTRRYRPDFSPSDNPSVENVPIILVDLKIIFSDFPEVYGVLRVTESAQKDVGGTPIANRKYSICWIFPIRNPAVWGNTDEDRSADRSSRETKPYPIRKRADRRRKHNKPLQTHVMAQHKNILFDTHRNFFPAITKDWGFALNLFFE